LIIGRHTVCLYDAFGQPFQLPADLGPGRSIDFHFHQRGVLKPLIDEGVKAPAATRAYVRTGHGRIQGDAFHIGDMIKALAPGRD
jgi:hypothetical protein